MIKDMEQAYRDIKNSIDTALELGRELGLAEGIEQGRAKERAAIVLSMLAKGLDIAAVSELTGLSIDEIRTLQK